MLSIHIVLVGWLSAHQSPNIDEPAHLAAGMAMWEYGSFDLYCVNPPLMRAIATLPILFSSHEKAWGDFRAAPRPRPEFVLGAQFIESHPASWEKFLVAARWALLPFTIAGGLFCFSWANEAFGPKAGLISLALWCFCPNIITWSSLICTDGAAAAMGIGAAYSFARWLQFPTWSRTLLAGLLLGLALLSKMTWLVLLITWPSIWVICRFLSKKTLLKQATFLQLIAVIALGLYVLNLGYAFDGSFAKLGDYVFYSRVLGGDSGTNRFSDTLLSQLPVPVPRPFIAGLDLQKLDFEQGMPSYLFGHWSDRGWWYYYLVGLLIKVPEILQ